MYPLAHFARRVEKIKLGYEKLRTRTGPVSVIFRSCGQSVQALRRSEGRTRNERESAQGSENT